ncbi:Methionyl-tRNA synthetase [Operophtera brumata]|uniref:Methionyl-tRNA synthetase n=1 Tax=Operophtera brumata TaxID=104452 RepID=A0A0L7LJS5_OPEBR|nr:Methionyl-tRNA synthetase [Operophtera brumata]
MKIYSNKNNTSTLKLLIAAKLAGKKVEIIEATFEVLEWEATRLSPAVSAAVAGKASPDLKQALTASLHSVDTMLSKHKYILGDKLTAADITIFGTLYPLLYKDDLKKQYLGEHPRISTWADLFNTTAVQILSNM